MNIDESPWTNCNIADSVAGIATAALLENGSVYDKRTGHYYDYNLKCYYIPEYRLYFSPENAAYYYYDEDSNSLQFYSSVLSEETRINNKENVEGEQGNNNNVKNVLNDCIPVKCEDQCCYPPCIRLLIKSTNSDSLSEGNVFIITCVGGTLGREGDHDILIPDELVEKLHCKFLYDKSLFSYEIKDMGSRTGTFLNGKRLSESCIKSEPIPLNHDSLLIVGSTTLLCHIHKGDETCDECHPPFISTPVYSVDKISSKEKYYKEMLKMKKKYNIGGELGLRLPSGYHDRSDLRRKKVGSSHPSEKTYVRTMDDPLGADNKGHQLLTKMGWKEGTPLARADDPTAMTEPLKVVQKIGNEGIG